MSRELLVHMGMNSRIEVDPVLDTVTISHLPNLLRGRAAAAHPPGGPVVVEITTGFTSRALLRVPVAEISGVDVVKSGMYRHVVLRVHGVSPALHAKKDPFACPIEPNTPEIPFVNAVRALVGQEPLLDPLRGASTSLVNTGTDTAVVDALGARTPPPRRRTRKRSAFWAMFDSLDSWG